MCEVFVLLQIFSLFKHGFDKLILFQTFDNTVSWFKFVYIDVFIMLT